MTSYNLPTQAEHNGDFSQTVTSTGVPITIKDPTTGQPFAGNKIPVSQINPIGSAMMNLFPLPFTSDPTGARQYNSQYQYNKDLPNNDKILRLDYNLGAKTMSYVRLLQHYQAQKGYGAFVLGNLDRILQHERRLGAVSGRFQSPIGGHFGHRGTTITPLWLMKPPSGSIAALSKRTSPIRRLTQPRTSCL